MSRGQAPRRQCAECGRWAVRSWRTYVLCGRCRAEQRARWAADRASKRQERVDSLEGAPALRPPQTGPGELPEGF